MTTSAGTRESDTATGAAPGIAAGLAVLPALVALVALVGLAAMVVFGARLGWIFEIRGGSNVYDLRGELAWTVTLTAGVMIGAILAVRRPGHPIPWLLMATGTGFIVFPGIVAYVEVVLRSGRQPGWLAYVAWIGNWIWMVGHLGGVFLLLLFPTGRLPGPRWRWVTRAAVIYALIAFGLLAAWPVLEAGPSLDNPFGVAVLHGLEERLTHFFVGFVVLQIVAVSGLVLRFVRSRDVERLQMKWMAFAAASLALTTIGAVLVTMPRWLQAIPTALIVGAIVVAVTQYRLYEIDRIISRTVSYAILSVVLGAVYVAGVVGLGAALRVMTDGGGGDLVVAASTLAVAALFQPSRRRVQSVVDRRFNRARYDVQRMVDAFSQRLRNEIDLASLTEDLQATATSALHPRGITLWLPPAAIASTTTTTPRGSHGSAR